MGRTLMICQAICTPTGPASLSGQNTQPTTRQSIQDEAQLHRCNFSKSCIINIFQASGHISWKNFAGNALTIMVAMYGLDKNLWPHSSRILLHEKYVVQAEYVLKYA